MTGRAVFHFVMLMLRWVVAVGAGRDDAGFRRWMLAVAFAAMDLAGVSTALIGQFVYLIGMTGATLF